MASKARKLVIALLCLLLFLGPSSQLDKLLPGQEIKFNNGDLVSNQGNFMLGFVELKSNNYYLGIWYNDNRGRLENLVWVANRDTPIFNNSGSLTIDNNGNLKISDNGSISIVLYSGQEKGNNTIGVLLDNGNFVLREQSSGRQLWQSFDYPTHVLLPGMKLGVNWKTGHTWSLRSWRGLNVPEVGDFTLVLNPNQTNRLVILWRGNIYWTSEPWNIGRLKLSYSNYSFSHVSNENETYFSYSLINQDFTKSPSLTIDYSGILFDSGGVMVDCSPLIDEPIYFGIEDKCAMTKLPECRSPDSNIQTFPFSLGNSTNGFKFNESDNLTIVDCQAKCLNNCSCIAYASTNEDDDAGCEIWSTLPSPEDIFLTNSVGRTIYNIKSPSKSTSYPIYHINVYNLHVHTKSKNR